MAPLGFGRAVTLRALMTVAAASTALLMAAAPALASVTATTDGLDTVTIESDSDADVMAMACVAGLANVNGDSASPDLACDDVAFVLVDAGEDEDAVNLGGVTLQAFPQLDHTSIEVADTSFDTVTGSEGRDVVHADSQDSVDTGAGNDLIDGAGDAFAGPGDDTLENVAQEVQAGPGDDRILAPGGGPIQGGDGQDTVIADYTGQPQQQVSLFISDVSLGPAPGIGATTSGIEEYDLTMSAGDEADTIDSTQFSGVVVVRALDGADTVRGGPGWDLVDGGRGNDSIDPGGGADVVRGGDGDDMIQVRDGIPDVVDCGAGTDTVTADRADSVVGCETVVLPAPETYPVVGTKKVRRGPRATFTFGSPVSGATFECQVDTGPFQPCTSPFAVKTRMLKKGRHTLAVRAVQPAGNPDPTPSTFRFRVVKHKKKQ